MDFKPLPIDIDDFKKLITGGHYFIDKTLLIKNLLDNKAVVNLFARPRRFGKTLNISMLQYFFEKSSKDNFHLFDNLKIMEAGEKYTAHMGQYPVINISLKSAKQASFELAYVSIVRRIAEEFKRHQYILDSGKLEVEKERYLKIVKEQGEEGDYIDSLYYLCECLRKYHEKKVIILIDEYDVPLENAFFEGFYDRMIKFIRSLFESALKTDSSLEFAVIAGCLGISREDAFNGLSNLNTISILNEYCDEYFGFTKAEVNKMIGEYGFIEREELIKNWYNGYIFGNTQLYNPWSVVQFVHELYKNKEASPVSYLENTGMSSAVKILIERADATVKREMELLIEGKIIEKLIYDGITYAEVYDTLDNLWNFMFFSGYLKKVNERIDEINQKYLMLEITNEDIKCMIKTEVLKWFHDKVKARDFSGMYNAIISGDAESFENELGKLLIETISFNDAYENFYHGFVIESLTNMNDYIIKSNREGGSGRSDLFIKSVSLRGIAIVIKFKVAKNIDELEEKAEEAIKQIENKGYDMELRSEGYKNVIKYGISFYQKDCLIKLKKE
ncbi:AAA-ATPase-like protein [Clostridium sp. DL-VIII]|uniref:AAA family ATPase n=1 Tax=Clostridium sp. DL-VIII TaxID=641107 RepID=UPI00023B087E|nr:AAA family ATPase [Clostridium sp. DL-VIII]EHJ01143.1 AAA-ATPase-like protein [Clostridium sp. DL-VIII]